MLTVENCACRATTKLYADVSEEQLGAVEVVDGAGW